MNILIVASNYFPEMCGYSTRLHGIVSHLADLGHKVTIIVPKRHDNMKDFENYAPNIIVKRYPYHGLVSGFTLVKTVYDLINSDNYDIISGHSPIKNVLATYIGNLPHKLPFIVTMHYSSQSMDLPKTSIKFRLWKLIDNFIFNRADKVAVISKSIKEELLNRGISPENLVILPNGVDTIMFSPRSKDIDIMNKFSLNGEKIIMYIGKFQYWEQLDLLVEIFYNVHKKLSASKLFLVGDGPARDKIDKMIIEYNLTNDVIITGFVPFSDVPKYYSICDVFVMVRPTTRHLDKTTPIKPLEAMSMGKVVVSTNVGGMREIIDDGKTGFLMPHSVYEITTKIIEVLNNPEVQKNIGENARKYVTTNRDWNVIANNLVNVYEELIHANMRVK